MTYVISDIHGQYDAYAAMLEKIHFSPEDTLYINGDILDRGKKPIKVILDAMERPNVVCLAGNHEHMAMKCLKYFNGEPLKLTYGAYADLANWADNGGSTTAEEFRQLDKEIKDRVMDYIGDFELYEELDINGREYIIVHGGLGNFEPDKPLYEYAPEELFWTRADYRKPYFRDKFVVTGHTPTQIIENNPRPGYIYRVNNHIAIDCGAGMGERLGCICLESGEEFYVEC